MAHLKRQAARMKRESVFEEIETKNEGKPKKKQFIQGTRIIEYIPVKTDYYQQKHQKQL